MLAATTSETRIGKVLNGLDATLGYAALQSKELQAFVKRVKASRDICELRNMINVGYLITRQAIERKECRGLHFTIDYPLHAYDEK